MASASSAAVIDFFAGKGRMAPNQTTSGEREFSITFGSSPVGGEAIPQGICLRARGGKAWFNVVVHDILLAILTRKPIIGFVWRECKSSAFI